MNSSLIIASVFVCASAVALAIVTALDDRLLNRQKGANARIDERFGQHTASEGPSAIFRDRRALFGDAKPRRAAATISDWIEQSGVSISPMRLFAWTSGLAAAAVAIALSAPCSPLVALPAGLLAACAPAAYVETRRRRRKAQLRRQLPDAFDSLCRAVRSGHTIQSALRNVADDFDGPIAEEYERCYGQQDLGVSPETAWRNLAERTRIMELRIFVVGMLVQGRSGGDLIELLEGLADVSRKRLRLRMKIKAATGEGRMQAAVLLLLPPAAFATILVLAPDYAGLLLDRIWLLAITATAQVIGAVWIHRILRVAY